MIYTYISLLFCETGHQNNMKLFLKVNPSGELPVYRQLVQQIKNAIGSSIIKPGDQLPSHRDLASELVIAPMTVKKAYDILQLESLIIMGSGKGTFVSEQAQKISETSKFIRIQEKINQLVIEALTLNIPLKDLKEHLGVEFHKIENEKKEKESL